MSAFLQQKYVCATRRSAQSRTPLINKESIMENTTDHEQHAP